MTLDDIPLFAMLRGRMGYLTERQRLIAQNIANADTPGYAPHDLKPFAIASSGPTIQAVAPAMTSPMHLAGAAPHRRAGTKLQQISDSETTLDGNAVVLEDETIKLNQSRMDYDAAVSFYQKSLGLIAMATKRPGSG